MGMGTQNMGSGGKDLSFSKKTYGQDPPPLSTHSGRVFTDKEREELKEIFREVMSEYGLIKMEG
jgi:hypothetical protein